MKTKKVKSVLLAILSLIILITISSCGEKEKQIQDVGKKQNEDLAGKVNVLTTTDIEKVSGMSGIKLVDKGSISGAGGNLNFATADGKMYAMLVLTDMDIFDQWKARENYTFKQLSNIGDEAYSAPGGGMQFIVFFRKGKSVGSVSSFINLETGHPYLSVEQLSDLARMVVNRM